MLLAKGHKSTEGNNYHEVNDRENNSNRRNSFGPGRVGEINQTETVQEHYSDNTADHYNDNATDEEL